MASLRASVAAVKPVLAVGGKPGLGPIRLDTNVGASTARAGNRRFWPSSARRAHTKTPYKKDLLWRTIRQLQNSKRPGLAQTIGLCGEPNCAPNSRPQPAQARCAWRAGGRGRHRRPRSSRRRHTWACSRSSAASTRPARGPRLSCTTPTAVRIVWRLYEGQVVIMLKV